MGTGSFGSPHERGSLGNTKTPPPSSGGISGPRKVPVGHLFPNVGAPRRWGLCSHFDSSPLWRPRDDPHQRKPVHCCLLMGFVGALRSDAPPLAGASAPLRPPPPLGKALQGPEQCSPAGYRSAAPGFPCLVGLCSAAPMVALRLRDFHKNKEQERLPHYVQCKTVLRNNKPGFYTALEIPIISPAGTEETISAYGWGESPVRADEQVWPSFCTGKYPEADCVLGNEKIQITLAFDAFARRSALC